MRNLGPGLLTLVLLGVACGLILAVQARAQNRGVYPLGIASSANLPGRVNVGFKYFQEFSNRSTFQGHSIQISGAVKF